MKFTVDGQTYKLLGPDELEIGELEDLEDATNMSWAELERKGEICVCTHYIGGHPRSEDENAPRSCVVCDCPAFKDITPIRANRAFMWLSMRRDHPGLTFESSRKVLVGAVTQDDVPENPTAPPEESGATESSDLVSLQKSSDFTPGMSTA